MYLHIWEDLRGIQNNSSLLGQSLLLYIYMLAEPVTPILSTQAEKAKLHQE